MRIPRKLAFAAVVAAAGISLGGLVDKVPGVVPDTYVDFPVKVSGPVEVVVSNAVGTAGDSAVRRFTVTAPQSDTNEVEVVVGLRRYRGLCAIYADGREIGRFADETAAPMHILVDETADEGADAFVQRLAPFAFADAFMVEAGDKTGLASWEKLAGDWSLHAVTGTNVRATERRVLARYPTQEKSPNFYCLSGFGENAIILAGEEFHSHYSVRASVHQDIGTNGIAFMAADGKPAFTFTAQQNPATGRLDFILRGGCVAGETQGYFLAGVGTELTPGQWYMLEARLTDNDVVCYVDGVAVVRHRLALPAGGRFGLYASTGEAHPARFDDVEARTWTGVDFALADEAPNTAKEMSFGDAGDPPAAITLPAKLQDFAALELGVGQTTNASATLRVERREPAGFAMYLVDGAGSTNDVAVLDEKGGLASDAMRHDFTLDATSPGFIDGRVDGVTYVTMRALSTPSGKTWYRIDDPHGIGYPSVTREPCGYTDRFEKNKFYVDDPFMRHWASTEGQWLAMTNGPLWYKDDVLSRVSLSLPAIDGIDLGLGVAEDGESADIRILCATNTLQVFSSFDTNAPSLFSATYPHSAMVGDKGAMTATNVFTVRLDGRRFSILAPDGGYFAAPLAYPHGGRRMLFRKAPPHYPANVFVHREPVIDCLFGESLHDWTINGGTWEVINRFQCKPEWSHMNGENGEGLAAIWSKYDIAGDFCATFVCGMRHGWYDRVGDFDMTVFNRAHTPSQGYTLKITEWDANHSQRRSRLLRDGALLAETDAKVAPRFRDGNIRLGYEPLVAKGRDVHGAWYTVKFRRMGKRLEAYFDNVPVFSLDDPEPLDSGSFGVWTYRNSMVVARVRVTAERISPHRFAFSPLQPSNPKLQVSNSSTPSSTNLWFSGLPVDFLRPELWHAADEVSCPSISFSQEDGETVMTVTSVNGSGSFLAAPVLPAATASRLAGWSFEVARSPDALFNFEFSVAAEARTNLYSHAICGERDGPDRRVFSGFSPKPRPTPKGSAKVWTPVTVWIPASGADPRDEEVILEGFGNLRPGDIQQGLRGNVPGAWYAVRRMRPIYRDEPKPDNVAGNEAAFAHDVAVALQNGKAGHLNTNKVSASICPSEPMILWTLPPADNQGLIAEYLPSPTNVIRVSSALPWPNPLVCAEEVSVGGQPAPLAYVRDSALFIPFQRPLKAGHGPVKVTFKTTGGNRPFTQLLPASTFADEARFVRVASVVLNDLPRARYEGFEGRTTAMGPYAHGALVVPRLGFGDDESSTFLRLENGGNQEARLSARLAPALDIASTPLVAFRYRGDDMAVVNISPRQNVWHRFGDEVMTTNRAVLDGKWHRAVRLLTDTPFEVKPALAFARADAPLIISASGMAREPGKNHTGLYSRLDLDNIAIGPSVGPTNNLGFHATFTAPVARAEYAIVADGEDESAAKWSEVENASGNMATQSVVSVKGVADGIHHLLVRGVLEGGVFTDVADIPFIHDTKPPRVTVNAANDPMSISIACDKVGAPPVLDGFRLTVDGDEIDTRAIGDERIRFSSDNSVAWTAQYAKLARRQIQKHKDGDKVVVQISGVRDGAGNEALPVAVTNKIDYASDKAHPSWTARYPWIFKGGGIYEQNMFFTVFGKDLQAKCVAEDGHPRKMLQLKTADTLPANPSITATLKAASLNWNSATNRWLIMRARLPDGAGPGTNVAFQLTFMTPTVDENGKPKNVSYTLKVPTSKPKDADRPAGLHGLCNFEPGKWRTIALDVDAFLRDASGKTGGVKIIDLHMRLPKIPGYRLDINYAVIMKDYQDPSKPIPLMAYDRSGLDGMYSNDTKVSDGLKPPAPDDLYRLLPKSRLVDLSIRDRAGNVATNVVSVPLPPR